MSNNIYIVESKVKCNHNAKRYINYILAIKKLNETRDLSNIRTEKHHIIPQSMGGSNNKINIIQMTLREHYIAHIMLALIYKNRSMTYALHRFKKGKDFNSRLYEKYKSEFVKNISGENNPMHGKNHTQETKKILSEKCSGKNSALYGLYGENHPAFGSKKSQSCLEKYYIGENNPMYGKKHTEETINNISVNRSKSIYIIRGKKYNSILEACNDTNLTQKAISFRCKSIDKKYSNYIKLDKNASIEIINSYLISTNVEYDTKRVMSLEEKNKISNSNTKYYYLIDDIRYNSTNEVSRILNLSHSQIRYRSESDKYPNFKKIKRED